MNQTIKGIIDKLVKADIKKILPLGEFVVDLMFPTGKRALLIDFDSRQAWLLAPEGTESQEILQLTELLSTFKTLETQGLIYVVEDQTTLTGLHFKYADSDICDKKEAMPYIDLSKDKTLKGYKENELWCIKKNDKLVLTSIQVPECMFGHLIRVIYSKIYPTVSLKQYQKHGYVTESEYYNQKALRYSRNSMIIACVIAVATLILSVPISNQWGKSTIVESQFDSLLNSMSEIKEAVARDTVFAIEQKDSSVTNPLTPPNISENGKVEDK